MCYWTEEKVDNLEWDIKTLNETKNMPHGPKTGADDNTRFLFADWRSPPNGLPNMAVVRSPIYQDSASSCRLLLQTYIAGDINSSAIAVALKDGEIHTPIGFLHADSSTLSTFKDTEIQVGRHVSNLQVKQITAVHHFNVEVKMNTSVLNTILLTGGCRNSRGCQF